jgi:hypothetical protein
MNIKRTSNLVKKGASELNRYFSKEVQMINKYMKKCSLTLAIRGIQIKTTLRFHLTLVRMATILKNANNYKWEWRCVGKGTLLHLWWDCKLVQSLWKAVWRFLKKKTLKIELLCDSAIPLLVLYPKESKYTRETPAHACL